MARPKLPPLEQKVYKIEFFVDQCDFDAIQYLARAKRQSRGALSRRLWIEGLGALMDSLRQETKP
jgi:hypothetical protein